MGFYMMQTILLVDDEPNSRFGVSQILTDEGYEVVAAENGREALEKFKGNSINLIVPDERMPDLTGMDLLTEVQKSDPQIPVILMTAFGSVSMAVEALKKGAYYFFEKPVYKNLEQFLAIVRQALKTQEMEKELDHLRREVVEKYSFPNIVGNHPKMLEVFEIIRRVARTDKTVLIQGESGTGKDLIAKTIHYNSLRREKPLVTVNCGALTESLLTTELFGHTKGAFTGAIKDSIGRFQMASEGTLVLDEISEIPINLQKTLLRVIEEKEFEKVGDSRSIKVDLRILCTTNRILRDEVARGNFREDLFYRVSIVPIPMPALRERPSDIPLLVSYFLRKFKEGSDPLRVEPMVLERLKAYSWPGNVRELANIVQQMIVFCSGDTITTGDLPLYPFIADVKTEDERGGPVRLMDMVSDLEKNWIQKKLKESNWNKEKAAELLGVTRKMLTDRIAKYRLQKPSRLKSLKRESRR
ncbi:MAG: sigma-54-dependent Fis family transcriptional regulator [Deltaproteobacteria bacterium]|nr:MAG: sigma-54-dependent Fis family transcriptional regulator [Deltaproteobacteria bacterium]